MAAMQVYSNAWVFIDGRLLTQESTVSVDMKSGHNPVFTTFEGLGGMSPGSDYVEISVDEAVPSADFDFNPVPYMKKHQVVEVKVQAASREAIYKCFVMEAQFGHSVNDPAKMSIKFTGRTSDFE